MNPAKYGDAIAEIYDELFGDVPRTTIQTLTSLAGPNGRALELGIGTGRIALPLMANGVEVHGVDASPRMISKLRAKPGGERIPITIDDFARLSRVPGGPFDLVYCVFNTFFALLTQEDQVRCFEGASSILSSNGAFVLELFVPDQTRFSRHQPVLVDSVGEDLVSIEASRHDPVTQRIASRLIRIFDGQLRTYPIDIRYAWPSELDLMGRISGLELKERWSGWDQQPFGPRAGTHVSVYRPARLG